MGMVGQWMVVVGIVLTGAGCCCNQDASRRHTTGDDGRAMTTPPATREPTAAGVASPPRGSASERTVNDLVVEQALFGSGTKLVDVAERVVQLLRSEPQGFKAEADWLRVDPVPGKTKSLWIRYVYRDTPP